MPTERIPAVGTDGQAHVVICKRPRFPAISRNSQQMDMATYHLENGEALSPTGAPHAYRTTDGRLELTLVAAPPPDQGRR